MQAPLLLSLLLVVGAIGLAVAAPEPTVCIPPSAAPVTLDGRLAPGEWDEAAVLRNLWLPGNERPLPVATVFRLKHEAEHLLVAVVCAETEPGYPKAFRRGPTDLLSDDDAVQVVLGLADEHVVAREVLKMGGYANALDQPVTAADHYYQFTVNAAGAISRTYNEGILERPLFTAATQRQGGGWSAEMRIPFSSLGLQQPAGRTILANLFRFRPPDMAAWHLPAFGGYVPMPFGKLVFLPRGQEGLRTIEPEPAPAALTEPTAAEPSLFVEWYPLARRVVATVSGSASSGAIVVRIPGLQERRAPVQTLPGNRLIVEVPRRVGLPVTAEAVLTDVGGAELARGTAELVAVPEPEWLQTDAGMDYVSERIPWPWTAPEVRGSTVSLLPGEMTFGSNGLPSAISRAGEEVLAGRAELIVEAGGRRLAFAPRRLVVSARGSRALALASAECAGGELQVRTEVDFDGFSIVKLRLPGIPPASITRLSLQFPLRPESALFVHRMLVQDIRRLTGFGWEGEAGPVWVGGHERGLAFGFDTPVFLSRQRRSQVQVVEEAGRTCLRLNLVDGPGQVTTEGRIFRFFLQPTPTKPVSLRKDGLFHTALWFEEWSDYQGYPDLSKLPEVKRRAAAAHAQGKPQVVYFGQLLAENAPGFQEYRSELIIPPGLMWYRRAYNPGLGMPCWVCCPRGPYGDLLLDGMRHLAVEADLDGVYMDGTTVPWECHHPAHSACDGTAVIGWETEDPTPLVATRSFLKRIRGIFDERGRPWLFAHTGGAIGIETLSLCDGYYDGEQLSRYRPGYRLPLHKFAVGYCGRPWGFRTDAIPASYGAFPLMALSALHDVEVGGECAELERRIYDEFQDEATTDYRPYWRPQPHIQRLAGDVVYSYYRKADAAMLVVSNLTWDRQAVRLDASRLFPGLEVRARDVVAKAPAVVAEGVLTLELLPHRFAAFRLSPRPPGDRSLPGPSADAASEPPPAVEVDHFRPEDWDLHPEAYGVTVEPGYELGDGRSGPRLLSKLYHDYATAELVGLDLARGGTVHLRLRASGLLRVLIGDQGLLFDRQRWSIVGDPWREGRAYHPQVAPVKTHDLVLSVRDGKLDAVYGGQALAAGVPVPATGTLKLQAWSDDWFAFDVVRLSSQPTALFADAAQHPVR
ncbi:MAG: hypothetical protein HPY69_09950 [Armatimonadetes bacterium]|nr:hypothetical protein [Armatimonadota bacterium]